MLLTRWQQREPFALLRGELDRLFDRSFRAAGLPYSPAGVFPAINMWEDPEGLYLEAEVPGVRMEDLELTVKEGELYLRGKREEGELQDGNYHRRERGAGEFSRVVRLPAAIDMDHIEATLRDGVVTIRLAKAPEERPRRIAIK